MTEDVRMVVEKRSESFCPDRGRLRDFVADILDFARSVPRDAKLEYNDDFTLSVEFKRPETDTEREQRITRDMMQATHKYIRDAQIANDEISQMESLMRKYKDIAEIKMRNIRECVNVK